VMTNACTVRILMLLAFTHPPSTHLREFCMRLV
jgi:hypothetical protein